MTTSGISDSATSKDRLPLADAWLEILKRPTLEEFAAAFTMDVALDTSVVSRSIVGAANVRRYFDATRAMYNPIAFTHETSDRSRICLEWEGGFEGRDIAGITILARDARGVIESIRLYHRPYDQVLAFSAELARRLKGKIDPLPVLRS